MTPPHHLRSTHAPSAKRKCARSASSGIDPPRPPHPFSRAHTNKQYVASRQVGSKEPQRITMELFANTCPKTCANFLHLCKGDKGNTPSGIPLHYKGSIFHRVIKNFMLQVGWDISSFFVFVRSATQQELLLVLVAAVFVRSLLRWTCDQFLRPVFVFLSVSSVVLKQVCLYGVFFLFL